MLDENDENVKAYALKKLGEERLNDNVMKILLSKLNVNSDRTKVKMINILNQNGYMDTACYASKFIEREKDPYLISVMLKSLGIARSGEYVPNITAFLINSDDRVRANAVEALGMIRGGSIIDFIEPMKEDVSHRVKLNVLTILYEKRGEEAVKDFIRLSKHENKDIRAATAFSLHKVHSKKVFSVLISLLRDKEAIVRKNAVRSLMHDKNITYIKYFVEAFTREDDQSVMEEIIKALNSIDPEKAVQSLYKLVNYSMDEDFIVAFIRSLSILKCDMSVSILTKYLSHENSVIRENAVLSLGNYKDRKTVDVLLPYLHDRDADVKITAAKVLWKFGIMNAYTSLRKMLTVKDENIRKKAKYILALMGM